jgi:hypothetical protein
MSISTSERSLSSVAQSEVRSTWFDEDRVVQIHTPVHFKEIVTSLQDKLHPSMLPLHANVLESVDDISAASKTFYQIICTRWWGYEVQLMFDLLACPGNTIMVQVKLFSTLAPCTVDVCKGKCGAEPHVETCRDEQVASQRLQAVNDALDELV